MTCRHHPIRKPEPEPEQDEPLETIYEQLVNAAADSGTRNPPPAEKENEDG